MLLSSRYRLTRPTLMHQTCSQTNPVGSFTGTFKFSPAVSRTGASGSAKATGTYCQVKGVSGQSTVSVGEDGGISVSGNFDGDVTIFTGTATGKVCIGK